MLESDSTVGNYRLSFRGMGGSCATYLAYSAQQPERTLFVKEVDNRDEQSKLALERESAFLSRFDYPGIVAFRDFLPFPEFSYLFVDYVPGSDLEQVLQKQHGRCLLEADVLNWARQIAATFHYLHSQNPPTIYRDLKPNNLLLAEDGRVILIDFGSVRHFKKDQAKDTYAFGTVMTASPEHYGGQTDERSDIYCFGATLHYLLTNGSPKKFFFDLPKIHDNNPVVSAAFCELIERCTRVSAAERPQSFQEVQAELETF